MTVCIEDSKKNREIAIEYMKWADANVLSFNQDDCSVPGLSLINQLLQNLSSITFKNGIAKLLSSPFHSKHDSYSVFSIHDC